MAGCFEHINEPLGFIKDGDFIDHPSNYQLLHKYLWHGVEFHIYIP